LSFLGTNLLQDSVAKHFVSSAHDAYMLAKFSMQDDIFTNWKHGDIPPHNNFDFFVFETPFCLVLCRIGSKYNRRQGRLFVKKGRMMRTWQPCLCPCVVHGLEKMESSNVFQVKKKVQG
jgi:hypothetical protein